MKISELINKLHKVQEEYGDRELVTDTSVPFSYEPVYSSVDEVKFYSIYVKDTEAYDIPKGEYLEIVI